MSARLGKLILGGVAIAGAAAVTRTVVRQRRRFDLRGRTAVVTGATRGLGLELARQLAGEGVRLAICGRDEEEVQKAATDLAGRGAVSIYAGVCDITDTGQVRDFVERVRQELGPIDVLINNAGIITVGPFETLSREDFQQAFATHVGGPLELIRECLPDMRKRGGGRIVNIASIGGKVPVPHMASYVASKHALVGLSETLRTELIADNVYVTVVNPGVIRTGSPLHARFKGDPQREYAWFATVDNTPGISISPRRLAARIIDALVHGDAALTTPWDAKVGTAVHGLLGGMSVEIASLIERLLPHGRVRRPVPGFEADVGQLPALWKRELEKNAEDFKQGHS